MSGVSAAAAISPEYERAWDLFRAGQLQAAEDAFRALLQEDPGSSAVWSAIGVTAYSAKRYEPAERAFRKALSFDRTLVGTRHHLASTLRALGKIEEALKLFEEVAGALGNDPLFLNNWGNALVAAGQPRRGADVLARALALRSGADDLIRSNLARALLADKRAGEAVDILMAGPHPERAEKAADLGNALLSAERYEEAARALRRARDAGLANGDDLHNLGTALQFLGHMDEAQAVYREAIARKPELAMSRRQLSGIVKFSGSEQELAELRAALEEPDLPPGDRAEIYMGLAKAYDDMGDYRQAFASLQAGNQLVRMGLDYSAEVNSAYVDRTIETFTRAFLAERRDWGNPSRRPIFILGMPRSGTTLCEQILCSHPDVHGAGELMTIFEIFRDLRKALKPDLGMPRIASLVTPEATLASAQVYLDHIGRLNANAPRVSDKMPFNFRYVGLISLLFPNAKIIHTVRHPLDTGLSCYFARFNDQLEFSFNLAEIGGYYRDYERLMKHWMDVVENEMLTISYDRLVHDQEGETRRLLQFCELDWDDRCLAFFRTERPVLTASNWQVRQPMYATSSGRWRRYRERLRPMMATMGLTDPDAWQPPPAAGES
jgi:tetratricopeptide (TPR) repeat protein